MKTNRRDREWYRVETAMRIARSLAVMSTCKRLRVGCALVGSKLSEIASVGYNGPPMELPNDSCTGEQGACGCVHAETNAISRANGVVGTLYVTRSPCVHCAGVAINSRKVSRVVYDRPFRDDRGIDTLRRAGIPCDPFASVVPRVIVVGERTNGDPETSSDESIEDTWRRRLCQGAFSSESSVDKLSRIGVDLTTCRSANLLGPSATVGEWSDSDARASFRSAETDQTRVKWIACGRRVWSAIIRRADDVSAFGTVKQTIRGDFVMLVPHPSGLNRWWNDVKTVKSFRPVVEAFLRDADR